MSISPSHDLRHHITAFSISDFAPHFNCSLTFQDPLDLATNPSCIYPPSLPRSGLPTRSGLSGAFRYILMLIWLRSSSNTPINSRCRHRWLWHLLQFTFFFSSTLHAPRSFGGRAFSLTCVNIPPSLELPLPISHWGRFR